MKTRLRLVPATLAGLFVSGAAAQEAPHAFVGATIETVDYLTGDPTKLYEVYEIISGAR